MKVARSTFVCVVALAAIGCGSAAAPPATSPQPPRPDVPPLPETAAEPAPPVTHTVARGDTLWSLSRRYGVSVDDFVAANDLADPNSLGIGDVLIVPGAARAGTWLWPIAGGRVLSGFGRRGSDQHRGLDIDARRGQPVRAAWSGTVVYSGSNMRGYGRSVILDHGGGLTSLYAHNSELLVAIGDRVERGEPIALAGDSGNATAVHCHFEVRRGGRALDPMQFLAR